MNKVFIFLLFLIFSCSEKKEGIPTLSYRHYSNGERTVETIINDEKNGYWTKINDNGVVVMEGCYYKNQLHGQFRFYYDNGSLMNAWFFDKGILDSTYINYFPDGNISVSGGYQLGNKIGIWKYYEERDGEFQGGLSYIIEYINNDTIVLLDNGIVPPLPDGTPAWKNR
jgi:antitoxin component YwqK of YwqJK toxin-antitoxin module